MEPNIDIVASTGPRTWDRTMADVDVGRGTKAEDVGEGNVLLIS